MIEDFYLQHVRMGAHVTVPSPDMAWWGATVPLLSDTPMAPSHCPARERWGTEPGPAACATPLGTAIPRHVSSSPPPLVWGRRCTLIEVVWR